MIASSWHHLGFILALSLLWPIPRKSNEYSREKTENQSWSVLGIQQEPCLSEPRSLDNKTPTREHLSRPIQCLHVPISNIVPIRVHGLRESGLSEFKSQAKLPALLLLACETKDMGQHGSYIIPTYANLARWHLIFRPLTRFILALSLRTAATKMVMSPKRNIYFWWNCGLHAA